MTTDLLDLARRMMASSPGSSTADIAATTSGDDRPAADVRTDPPGEDPPGPRGGDLLAIARSIRTGDATDTGCAISEIRGERPSPHPFPRISRLSRSLMQLGPLAARRPSSPSAMSPAVVAAATPVARQPMARGTTDHPVGTTATTR